MKKLWIALLLVLLVTIASASAVFAAEWDLVADFAGTLTVNQQSELLRRAERISESYRCDVAIVTLERMQDNDGAYEWARYIYEEYGYGFGSEKSGLLFFLSLAERDYSLIAYGNGNIAFTDYGKDVMLDRHILPLLRDNKYSEAFSVYLDKAEEFLQMAREGTPFDRTADPGAQQTVFLIKLGTVFILPPLIALIVCSMWKRQMKTATKAKTACSYIPAGGFNLTGQTDTFLFRTLTRTKIQTNTSSSGSGGTTKDSRGYSGRSGKF